MLSIPVPPYVGIKQLNPLVPQSRPRCLDTGGLLPQRRRAVHRSDVGRGVERPPSSVPARGRREPACDGGSRSPSRPARATLQRAITAERAAAYDLVREALAYSYRAARRQNEPEA